MSTCKKLKKLPSTQIFNSKPTDFTLSTDTEIGDAVQGGEHRELNLTLKKISRIPGTPDSFQEICGN